MTGLKQVVVYPRGFLGYNIGLPVQREDTDIGKLMNSVRYNKPTISRDKAVIANTDIEALHSKYIRGDRSVQNMDFREKALIAAMSCFGTQSFFDWCELQTEGPYFTDLHKRFLNDTFRFIKTGERSMSVRSWSQVISVRAPSIQDSRVHYGYQEFFQAGTAALLRKSFLVSDIVADWTSNPGGFEDMMATLRVFFGDTPKE